MTDTEEIKKEIDLIKKRNSRVEADKAWEISGSRILFIALATYIVTAIVFYLIGVNNFLLSAFIPTIGYCLSIQSLPFIKKWWIDRFLNKNR